MERDEIEAQRGIVRDKNGIIIRSDEWKRDRIKFLLEKRGDYLRRLKNSEELINELQISLGEEPTNFNSNPAQSNLIPSEKTMWDKILEFLRSLF